MQDFCQSAVVVCNYGPSGNLKGSFKGTLKGHLKGAPLGKPGLSPAVRGCHPRSGCSSRDAAWLCGLKGFKGLKIWGFRDWGLRV